MQDLNVLIQSNSEVIGLLCYDCQLPPLLIHLESPPQEINLKYEEFSDMYQQEINFRFYCEECSNSSKFEITKQENQKLKEKLKQKDEEIQNLQAKIQKNVKAIEEREVIFKDQLSEKQITSYLKILEDCNRQFQEIFDMKKYPLLDLVSQTSFQTQTMMQESFSFRVTNFILKEMIDQINETMTKEVEKTKIQNQELTQIQNQFIASYSKQIEDGTISEQSVLNFIQENQRDKKYLQKKGLLERIQFIEAKLISELNGHNSFKELFRD